MATEVPFKEESDDNKLEALRLEHFFFPLVLWLAGLGLSALSFIKEIFIKPGRLGLKEKKRPYHYNLYS